MDTIRIYADASVRDHRTGLGYCLKAWNGGEVLTLDVGQKRIDGELKTTVAEYRGLLLAIEEAAKFDATSATLHTDSKSIARAIQFQSYNDAHVEYVGKINSVMGEYDEWRALWTERTDNQTAHDQSRIASSPPTVNSAES